MATWRPRARTEPLLGQALGQSRKEADSWLFLASVPPGKSLKDTLEPLAERGPNQHNPPRPARRAPSRARRETGRLFSLTRAFVCGRPVTFLPASPLRCPQTHQTFQVAQKLPHDRAPHGPGACHQRTGLPAEAAGPTRQGPAEALRLDRAACALLSGGRPGRRGRQAAPRAVSREARPRPPTPSTPRRGAGARRFSASAGRPPAPGRQAQGSPPVLDPAPSPAGRRPPSPAPRGPS